MKYELELDITNSAKGIYNACGDIEAAVEKTAARFHVTNRQVVELLPLDLYVKFLIATNVIPDIENYKILDKEFNKEWLNDCGKID